MQGYLLTLRNGERYTVDMRGAVLARTDGPRGWNYSGKWIILGAAKRHHSRHIIPLADIADGEDIGHGVVHDIDHGTHRVWGNPSGRRLKSVQLITLED